METEREAAAGQAKGREAAAEKAKGDEAAAGRAKGHEAAAGQAKGRQAAAGQAGERERAKQVMLRLLSVRMRSRRELELRLAGRRFSRDAIGGALDDLERVGLVDDRKFARLFLESRFRLRPRSYNVLTQELRSKGLADELITEVVDSCRREVSEEELARRALRQRLKSIRGLKPDEARARAARLLAGKGFSHSLIAEILQEL